MPPVQARKSYTAAFKLEVIKYAEENSNRAAEREFGFNEKNVRRWRQQKDILHKTKKSQKAFRTKAPFWPELENELESFVLEQRAACRALNTVQLRMKAVEIAKSLEITNFKGGPSWCYRFMKRKNLSIRQRTTLSQQLPADSEEKITAFRQFVIEQTAKHSIKSDNIINMDEVPLTFDIPMGRTVEFKGTQSINIRTTGHEKSSFTVVLSCTATGKKLPPMVVFKRKTAIKEKIPSGIVVHQNEKGWMDNDVMDLWLTRCYTMRPGGFFRQSKSLLVLDSMRAHISDISKERIKATDSIPAVIPGGLTKVLQPLDISVNKCFKAELRRIWEEWMTNGEKSYTKTGRMRRASYETVCGWIKDAWSSVPDTTVISGFVKAGIIDVPLPEDNETIPLAESTDELPLAVAAIFHSDTEESDFDGFEDGDY
jgi:transposase-like protein